MPVSQYVRAKRSTTWLEVIGTMVCWTSQAGGSGACREVVGQEERIRGGCWLKEVTGLGCFLVRGADIGLQPPLCRTRSPPIGSGLLQPLPMLPRPFPKSKSRTPLLSFWKPPEVMAMSEHALSQIRKLEKNLNV